MGFYEPGIDIDSFEPVPDGLLRVCRVDEAYAIGAKVAIDDEIMGFARVVKFEGDAASGWGRRLTGPLWTWSSPRRTGVIRSPERGQCQPSRAVDDRSGGSPAVFGPPEPMSKCP